MNWIKDTWGNFEAKKLAKYNVYYFDKIWRLKVSFGDLTLFQFELGDEDKCKLYAQAIENVLIKIKS